RCSSAAADPVPCRGKGRAAWTKRGGSTTWSGARWPKIWKFEEPFMLPRPAAAGATSKGVGSEPMFTGIVLELGEVRRRTVTAEGATFTIAAPATLPRLRIGES